MFPSPEMDTPKISVNVHRVHKRMSTSPCSVNGVPDEEAYTGKIFEMTPKLLED